MDDDDWEDCAYRLLVDPEDGLDLDGVEVDLPFSLAVDVKKYRATLGHKVNHSFDAGNMPLTITDDIPLVVSRLDFTSYPIHQNPRFESYNLIKITNYYVSKMCVVSVSVFLTVNCTFGCYIHPRFGRIPCIVTSRDIKAGEELMAFYNYLLSDCPKWYSELWDSKGLLDEINT